MRQTTAQEIVVDPHPTFDLSPHLYSQFMEPLGTTDGSVEACWDHMQEDWRPDFVQITKKIAPSLIRWGGCFSSYYRWKEAVGPRSKRVPMYNILWGGIETNQVGTHEFVDLCHRAKAQPFYSVNFESDGRAGWATIPKWGTRSAGPKEAADWVDYCNNPDNKQRKSNGAVEPFGLKLWQLGNETSFDPKGFDCETAAKKTVEFAKAMRHVDPSIQIIAWGDSGWARRMIEVAGDMVNYVAYHTEYRSTMNNQPFADDQYRLDPDATWEHLMTAADYGYKKLAAMREQVEVSGLPLALTEGHFMSVPGLNRGRYYSTWATGVAYARIMNMYQRNGDILKIAIICDYAGTNWMCNGVIIPELGEKVFMMPVTHIMTLFSHNKGKKATKITKAPEKLDVTASRTERKIFLHVVNTNRTRSVRTALRVAGMKVTKGKVFTISQPSEFEVFNRATSDLLTPTAEDLPATGEWTFPGASVTALELSITK